MRFQLLDHIKVGQTSIVCRCRDTISRTVLAAKVMEDVSCAMEEVYKMRDLGHPNVINVLDCFERDGCAAIVMPVMHTDLCEFVPRDSKALAELMVQICRGLDHMHTRGMVHLDIKPANIGVVWLHGPLFQCKILDLGSAVYLDSMRIGQVVRTTPEFCAPELLLGVVSEAADVYSLGCVFKQFLNTASEGVPQLCADMIAEDPGARPSSADVLVRLGDPRPSLWIRGCLWTSTVASIFDGDSEMLINDTSHHLHKIVTLVTSDVDNAFWLLQEEARREVIHRPSVSVLSVLTHFHPHLRTSRMACYFYARALAFLSRLPYFLLSDEMRLHAWRISVYPACECMVARVLARSSSEALTAWCCDRPSWGSCGEPFMDFARRMDSAPYGRGSGGTR
jgi:serine/threonine protein kinase